jgi:hypothetical protein
MFKSFPLKIMLYKMQQYIAISSKKIKCSLTIILSSHLQIINVSPLSIFTFQDFSNDFIESPIWTTLTTCIFVPKNLNFNRLQVCPKWKKTLRKVSHLGELKLTFPTWGSVYESCALSFMMKKNIFT